MFGYYYEKERETNTIFIFHLFVAKGGSNSYGSCDMRWKTGWMIFLIIRKEKQLFYVTDKSN